jgi:hypothetical protein
MQRRQSRAGAVRNIPARWHAPIDISWLDWAYKSSIPVTACIVDTAPRHLYYGGQI